MPLPPASMSLLGSVVGLNLWHFFMEGWMYSTRIPEISSGRHGPVDNTKTPADLFKDFPPEIRWKADNYNHLFEQPTNFYALALVAAFLAKEGVTKGAYLGIELGDVDAKLAWTYVGIRIVHSLVQSTTNHIMTRFSLFLASSAVLLGMSARVASVVFA